MGQRVTVVEFAEHMGVGRSSVYKAIKSGRIHCTVDSMLDLEEAIREWNGHTTPKAIPTGHQNPVTSDDDRPEANDQPDYFRARARRESAKADLAELEVAQKRGELVSVQDVQRGWDDVCRAIRGAVEALPDRLATLASPSVDEQRRLAEVFRPDVAAVLKKLADDIRAMGSRSTREEEEA